MDSVGIKQRQGQQHVVQTSVDGSRRNTNQNSGAITGNSHLSDHSAYEEGLQEEHQEGEQFDMIAAKLQKLESLVGSNPQAHDLNSDAGTKSINDQQQPRFKVSQKQPASQQPNQQRSQPTSEAFSQQPIRQSHPSLGYVQTPSHQPTNWTHKVFGVLCSVEAELRRPKSDARTLQTLEDLLITLEHTRDTLKQNVGVRKQRLGLTGQK